MRLARISTNADRVHMERSTRRKGVKSRVGPDEFHVVTKFLEFGAGSERFSEFDVDTYWHDIEANIAIMIELGHPKALALDRARRLASAISAFVDEKEAEALSAANAA